MRAPQDHGLILRPPALLDVAQEEFSMTECKRYLLLILALAAGLSIVACGGASNTPPPVPADFSVTIQPGSVAVTQGNASSPVAVSVAPLHNFSGSVAVSITGLPAGITSSPASPFQVAAGASQAVTFAATKTATLGPVNLTFQGTSGSLSHSAVATMAINPAPDFALEIAPGQVSVTQGSSSTPVSIGVTALNSFTGKVAVNIAGLPAGVTASPALPLQLDAGTKQQVTFTAAASVAPGTASALVQASSGSLSHSANAALQIQAALVPDFGLALDSSAVALKQGGSQPVNLNVSPINAFGDNVAISISGLPAGVTVTPGSQFTAAAGSKTVLTFKAASNAPAGNASVTITGADGSLNHTQTASVQVLADTTPTFSVAYFDSSLFPGVLPDQSIRIVNPGVQSTTSALGDLCANIYVFDSSQELKECCSCPVTANGYIRLSVNSNLTNNPGNGASFNVGSVAVVPSVLSATSACDPTTVSPVPSLNVWGTHVATKGAGFGLVETLAPSAPLSGPELTELQSICGFIVGNQSGAGVCSCTTD